ncbi:MAG: Nramp family divalent metal transporter [Pseudomonadales bacterium]
MKSADTDSKPSWGRRFGPGLLVTAAFIGPGTITTASVAGARFGYALLWALLFSVVATMVLQEMAARLGLVTRRGLAEAIRDSYASAWFGKGAILLVVFAVGFGNAAYEAGNITGAGLGLENITGWPVRYWALAVGLVAGAMLFSGRYALIERVLVALVLLMSVVFLLTLFMVGPNLGEMFKGLLAPSLPTGSLLTVMALIGTTVVPYNLFLHSSAVLEKWPPDSPRETALRESRWDTGLSIGIGGLITLAVLSTSAAAFFGINESFSAATMAQQLEPLLGSASRYIFGLGLFAAGLSSAVTAPLAAAYAVCGVLGWTNNMHATGFRTVWLVVLLSGTGFASLGVKPLTAILFAQAANGFLLPLCALFLLAVMNQEKLLGKYRNRLASNSLGAIVVLITLLLGGLKIAAALG